jgi:two-component system OmpR family response regulator
MQVLIIEDDRDMASFLKRSLEEAGHAGELAADGEEGLNKARDRDYDVLIVDRMLPKKDGISVVSEYRSGGGAAPVLFLSALSEVDRPGGRACKAGGDDYLAKPMPLSNCWRGSSAAAPPRHPAGVKTRHAWAIWSWTC